MVYYVQPVEPLGFVHLSTPWPPCRMKLKLARKVSSNLLPQDVGLKDFPNPLCSLNVFKPTLACFSIACIS